MQGNGLYALISTIEIPSFGQGWNNFGYPVPGSRPITTALASIDTQYTRVAYYDYDLGWLTYDQAVSRHHPEFQTLVNTLSTLEFGRDYRIYVTQPTTLYLGVAEDDLRSRSLQNELEPLATYYGWINTSDNFVPTVGMAVKALIADTVCGETQIVTLEDRLVYNLQVRASSGERQFEACGAEGREISFSIAGQKTSITTTWDNHQAWFSPLTPTGVEEVHNLVYLPMILK